MSHRTHFHILHGSSKFHSDRLRSVIINYLRDGELTLPDGATFLKELEAEAKFYQIQGILDVVRPRAPKNFEESLILTNEEYRTTLENWLLRYDEWHLLFRVSRYGFTAQAFHANCDEKRTHRHHC